LVSRVLYFVAKFGRKIGVGTNFKIGNGTRKHGEDRGQGMVRMVRDIG